MFYSWVKPYQGQDITFQLRVINVKQGYVGLLTHYILSSKRKCALCFRQFSVACKAYRLCIWYQNQDQNMCIVIAVLDFEIRCHLDCFCHENDLGVKMKVARLL